MRLLAVILGLAMLTTACGGDDSKSDSSSGGGGGDSSSDVQKGGEFVDLGTVVGDPLEHIDPALNTTLDGYQIINAIYDGLTETDFTDPDKPEVKGLVAESWTANDNATEFVFKIKTGQVFSSGEPVLPSSFVRAWERASNPDFAGDYSYLFNFLQGGKEKLAGTAKTISGITADDAAMTLTTKLSAPYANWPTVAGFQTFYPMPKDIDSLADQNDWENGVMVGNGPYKLAQPRNDQEVVIVKNDKYTGDQNGKKWADRLDKITFKTSTDPDSSYNAFEAGEGDNANVPPGRWGAAKQDHKNTIRQALGTRYFEIKWTDPVVGGEDNVDLRKAILQAVDREEINKAIYDGTSVVANSLIPPGIDSYKKGICEYCKYDPDAAKANFEKWKSEGHSLTAPIKIQLNANAGHEPVVQIIVDDLKKIGIDAVADPRPSETYFSDLADGACVICRSGWYADYPTADNFTYDLFSTDAVGGNNHGFYSNPEFDSLIAQAKSTTDEQKAIDLYRQAEDILLNKDVAVFPYLYYSLDYVYGDNLAKFPMTPLGIIEWEQVAFKA
jgi:ABC-type oligopeptide transport system substrate-binding subunit